MDHVGMDLGKKECQVAIITEAGELLEKRLRRYLSSCPRAKFLMDACTISEWIARLLEGVGHEVIVGNPNCAPRYTQRSRLVKTDRRDALALAEACRLGAYRLAHRTCDEQRHARGLLTAHDVTTPVALEWSLARGRPQA